MTDILEITELTGDCKPIPVIVHIDVDEASVGGIDESLFITKVIYGNLTLSFDFIKQNDIGSAESIMEDVREYIRINYPYRGGVQFLNQDPSKESRL